MIRRAPALARRLEPADVNFALDFSALAVGPNFALVPPAGELNCAALDSMGAGNVCGIGIEFTPTTVGNFISQALVTDNSNNQHPVIQWITLSGTSLQPQTITFAPITNAAVGGLMILTASASSGLPVTTTSLTPNVCTVTGNVTAGQANGSYLLPGTCTIQASQPGNAQYAPAPTVTQSVIPLCLLTPESASH